MLENNINSLKVKTPSNKSFGIVFSFFFIILNLILYFNYNAVSLILIVISIFFIFLTIFYPRYLYLPNKLWTKFGFVIGKITTPVIISLIYFISVAPFGIIFTITNKDFINQKFNKKLKTYWINKKNNIGNMKDQY